MKKNDANISLEEILAKIERANDEEINRIIKAIIHRYANAYPDEEVMFLTLPMNDLEERRRTLDAIFRTMSEQK